MNVVSVKQVLMRTRLPEGLSSGQKDKAFMVDQHGLRRIEMCEADTLAQGLDGNGSMELLDPGKRKPGDTNHMQVLILNPQAQSCKQIDLDTASEINFEGVTGYRVFGEWLSLYSERLRMFSVPNNSHGGFEICVIDNFNPLQNEI